jgi:hypothetical protein
MSYREFPTFARWRGRFKLDSRKIFTTETLSHGENPANFRMYDLRFFHQPL